MVVPVIIAFIFIVGGVTASSFVTSMIAFELTFGVCFGIGVGCAYLAPVVCGWEYFPNRKGFVSGVIFGGFGLGSFVFSFVMIAIVNPEGDTPKENVPGGKIFGPNTPQTDRFPELTRWLAGIWAVVLGLGCLML